MALNIKDPEAERLAAEVAAMTGESKTGAIRQALRERRERLSLHVDRRHRKDALLRFLEQEIWPAVPKRIRGRRLSRKEEDEILGYGPSGA
ncbi:MAG TPA: type II toxin-antitoxin system VapB family antitoxin [Vicinamibacteria bacterium]|nr:type II toxin-antitoxin system VapB family antitoxin [Vicinamibacteria bacterium]